MEERKLYIYGASGHAKVVIDIAESTGQWKICGVLDDKIRSHDFFGYPVVGGAEYLSKLDPTHDHVIIAVGDNAARRRLGVLARRHGLDVPALVHPSAVIARDVTIGSGTVVMAGAIVNPATVVGSLCILNTACGVDHDNILGEAVHISPGAHLAGGVKVEDESWVGIGATVIQQRRIGKRCIVGAGAVVISDIPDEDTVVGVPARSIFARIPFKAVSALRT